MLSSKQTKEHLIRCNQINTYDSGYLNRSYSMLSLESNNSSCKKVLLLTQ